MNLTPVHTRRKRKFASSTSPLPLQLAQISQRKPQRTIQQVRLSRLSKRTSRIDSLPTEILELILLYSSNVALPLTSPMIGLKLSGRFTLLRLFMWAFHDTWLQWFGIPNHGFYPMGPALAPHMTSIHDGDYELQTALLEQPWAKIDFILQAHQTWADKYARDRWYQHIHIQPPRPQTEDVTYDLDSHGCGGFNHFNALQCFEADYHRQIKAVVPHETVDSREFMTEIHPKVRIPRNLITGPWTEDQRKLLYWLCRAGYDILKDLPPWEDRLLCVQRAVVDAEHPDVLVKHCLLNHPQVYQDIPRAELIREIQRLQKRLDWGGDAGEARTVLRSIARALQYVIEQG